VQGGLVRSGVLGRRTCPANRDKQERLTVEPVVAHLPADMMGAVFGMLIKKKKIG